MRPMTRAIAPPIALLLAAAPVTAQAPAGWRWLPDTPARVVEKETRSDAALKDTRADTTLFFTNMAPGWHITTGPGALLFDPAHAAQGRYTLETQIFIFPGSGDGEYGLFVGGRDLEGGSRSYTAFLLRADGSAAVIRQSGGATSVIAPWTRRDSVRPRAGEPVGNVLKVTIGPSKVVFRANDAELLAVPREQLPLEGQFGFRVGRGVNLHAASLNVTQHLAPARP